MWDQAEIQRMMQAEGMDGWLLYNFRDLNPIARRLAPVPQGGMLTRRWAYYLPAQGEPLWLVHRIEQGPFEGIVGKVLTYVSWGEFRSGLAALIGDAQRVALEYSPSNAIPYVSRVDAGTVELLRQLDIELLSSADLVQAAEARWNAEQLAGHRRAAAILYETVQQTFAWLGERLRQGGDVDELSARDYVADHLRQAGLVFDDLPDVAVNAHSGNPHFQATPQNAQPIHQGDFVLIDLWGKEQAADAVYADITWVGYAGAQAPETHAKIFEIVKKARDAAVQFIQTELRNGQSVYGCQVDDITRKVIHDAGYGAAFIHRTGHSIGTNIHGNGVNLDNIETQDARRLIPGVAFSVEPGIYLPEFGVRSEINMYVGQNDAEVTTQPLQQSIVTFL